MIVQVCHLPASIFPSHLPSAVRRQNVNTETVVTKMLFMSVYNIRHSSSHLTCFYSSIPIIAGYSSSSPMMGEMPALEPQVTLLLPEEMEMAGKILSDGRGGLVVVVVSTSRGVHIIAPLIK